LNYSSQGNKVGEVIILILLIMFFSGQLLVVGLYGSIIGLLIGFADLKFVNSRINKFQLSISEKYDIYLNDDEWFIRWFYYPSYSIANRSFQLADKIKNTILRNGVKFTLVAECLIIYVYIFIFGLILLLLLGAARGGSSGSSGSSESSGSSGSNSSKNPLGETHRYESNIYDNTITSLKDGCGAKVGELKSYYFDNNRQAIKDKNGKVVGELDSNYFLMDDNKQAIKDENGNLIGHIEDGWGGTRRIKLY